jgi:hypothetical protein
MHNLFTYLVELNVILVIFFVAYKLFFERDKNFSSRRIYLMGIMVLSALLPLMPVFSPISKAQESLFTVNLEGITVFGSKPQSTSSGQFPSFHWFMALYLGVVTLGILRLLLQLILIVKEARRSDHKEFEGIPYYSSKKLHASSFFRYIFLDEQQIRRDVAHHILVHEKVHQREWHSLDRIWTELFVMVNWFNPLAWVMRRSVIENLEYLADSGVLRNGTDPFKYQLSILNQYIGSASVTNQFSSQIKNRINMLNRDYKLGSGWKLAILFPLIFIALIVISCAENETPPTAATEEPDAAVSENSIQFFDEPTFMVVEEMPTFNGGDPAVEFRKFIAQNVRYPEEAMKNGVSGRIFIQFVVTKEGKVVIPDETSMSKILGKPLDEVVVVSYRTMEKNEELPDPQYIQLLKDEVVRVVNSSPDWEPGKQRGTAVNVLFSFPVNFALQ